MAGGPIGPSQNPFLLQNMIARKHASSASPAPSGPPAITPQNMYAEQASTDPNSMQGISEARTFAEGGFTGMMGQSNPLPQFNIQSGYNNFASPNNSGFMQYPQQGQPNQPQVPVPQGPTPPTLSNQLPSTPQQIGGPDVTGNAPGENMGFDNSGSDAGVGGQPVNQMQTPMQGTSTQPPSLSNFMSPQGLQIQGNPTSQTFNRGSRS